MPPVLQAADRKPLFRQPLKEEILYRKSPWNTSGPGFPAVSAQFLRGKRAIMMKGQALGKITAFWSAFVHRISPFAFLIGVFLASCSLNGPVVVGSVVTESIDPFLSTPADGCIHLVPVVILRYLPTTDGIHLDVSKTPDHWFLGEITLRELKSRLDAYDLRVKFMLEEGSRFRGYKNAAAPPSLGYQVVASYTIYDQMPRSDVIMHYDQGYPVYQPDYQRMFERIGMEELVNVSGVREIWLWHGFVNPSMPSYDPLIHSPDSFISVPESNMSSPTTVDISNSGQNPDDLPVYGHTYTVYGQNFRRTQAEAVHNHGHQLERLFTYAETGNNGGLERTELFWQAFVGHNPDGTPGTGRCGWTHMPPNTTTHYDYTNIALVESDIEDWKPDGSGTKKAVNVYTWGQIPYAWPSRVASGIPQKDESQFYMYWMQAMPGHQNGLSYNGKALENWRRFVADWDAAVISGAGLYIP